MVTKYTYKELRDKNKTFYCSGVFVDYDDYKEISKQMIGIRALKCPKCKELVWTKVICK